MSTKTNISDGGIATYGIKVEGSPIPDESRVYSLEVNLPVNGISTAKIVLLDGDATTETFTASSSKTFVPGNKISIEAGYDSKNKIIFQGIITGQNILINETIGSALEVECYDASIKTTVGRKSKMFSNKTDSEILSSILGNYSGISTDITATETQFPRQVQYNTTDWDFLLSRAEANGLIITTLNGKVSVKKPDDDTTSVLTITYGDNLMTCNANLNAINQLDSVTAKAWDYPNQEIISEEEPNNHLGPGNLSSKKLSQVIDLSTFELKTPAPLQKENLVNLGKAQLVKSEYSKILGEVKCQGSALVLPAKYIKLAGLGERFNGNHFVSRVRHDISDGNWTTEISFGISPNFSSERSEAASRSKFQQASGVNGLFTATVKQIHEDPDNQYRILVDVPLFDSEGEGLWARHASFYATSNAGAFFLPEIGDEVVIGFLDEDPRFPIILGSLYSSPKLKPSEGLEPNEKNSNKAIVSKSGIQLTFDDENQIFTIVTPKNNTIAFNDKEKQITIKDENDNSFILSETGIEMKSPKSISISANEKVNISGEQGVTIGTSAGDVEINGMNIKQSADMQYSAEGGATASVQGGGQLTLKGAMVMIN